MSRSAARSRATAARGCLRVGAALELGGLYLLRPQSVFSTALFLVGLPFGRALGWTGQRRDAGALSWRAATRISGRRPCSAGSCSRCCAAGAPAAIPFALPFIGRAGAGNSVREIDGFACAGGFFVRAQVFARRRRSSTARSRSMRHEHRKLGRREDFAGGAAEDHLTQPTLRVAALHQQVGAERWRIVRG